jgi:hypothetical protein
LFRLANLYFHSGLRWEMYKCPSTPPTSFATANNRTDMYLPRRFLDPFPHRPDDHHRSPKDVPVLCQKTKSKRHSCIFCRPHADIDKMDLYRLHSRSVRYSHIIRRLPGHDCWIRSRPADNRTIYRHAGRSVGFGAP